MVSNYFLVTFHADFFGCWFNWYTFCTYWLMNCFHKVDMYKGARIKWSISGCLIAIDNPNSDCGLAKGVFLSNSGWVNCMPGFIFVSICHAQYTSESPVLYLNHIGLPPYSDHMWLQKCDEYLPSYYVSIFELKIYVYIHIWINKCVCVHVCTCVCVVCVCVRACVFVCVYYLHSGLTSQM